MKKEEIKSLFIVKEFTDYFVRRAKKVLKVKNSEFETVSIDLHPERGTIWVWFHIPAKVIAQAQFYFDGQCFDKSDYRKEAEAKIITQGKPEDA